MSEEELVENRNICALICPRLNEARKVGNYKKELELNRGLYEKTFDRYLHGPRENKFREGENLHSLAEDSQKIMLKLNHWEETA
jgi:hypothetical protein